MPNNVRVQHWPTSREARKGVLRGHPELAIECPRCHSAVGRTCFMEPGILGITHRIRITQYYQQQADSPIKSVATAAVTSS